MILKHGIRFLNFLREIKTIDGSTTFTVITVFFPFPSYGRITLTKGEPRLANGHNPYDTL
jgi:hypothetical protein